MDLLLPIVIGAVTAFTLLLLVTILIVKKKKSQLKYDAEKAEGHSDESQKLKSEEKFTSTRQRENTLVSQLFIQNLPPGEGWVQVAIEKAVTDAQ